MSSVAQRLRGWARAVKRQTTALLLAYRDPRTPWLAKAWAALVLAYAFSPIDLIPDFIPVLGWLDDVILLPLGVALAVRLVPRDVWADALARADDTARPVSWAGAAVIGALWGLTLVGVGVWLWRAAAG